MGCETLNQQPINLVVSMGALPEGFCPANFQELANAMATRLIVTPGQNNSSFVTGSVEPTSNVGPWLKDCEEFFFYDDATGRYLPGRKGGFDTLDYRTSSGTFIVPAFISRIKVHAWGGGGGGCDQLGGNPGSGGGSGAYGVKIFDVAPNQAIAFTVGSGGTGGTATGGTGGTTTFQTLIATGGTGAMITGAASLAGVGGSASGGDFIVAGGSGNSLISGTNPCGIGAGSPCGGPGGMTGPSALYADGKVPGGGGAGQYTGAGAPIGIAGSGAGGACLIEY